MNPARTLQEGMQYHRAGRLADAERCYRQILRADPKHPDALHLLGLIAHQTGNPGQAVELIRKAIAARPDYPDFYINLGNAAHALGRFDEAAEALRQALRLNPGYAQAHNNLGNVLKDQGRPDEALDCFRRAIQSSPGHVSAHYNAGNLLKEQGRLDEAAASFREALRLKPDYALAHYNLGNLLRDRNQLDAALDHYRQAVRFAPGFAEAHNNLGSLLRDQGRLDEAIGHYRQALQLKPDMAEAHNNMAIAHHELGQLDAAIHHYGQALQGKPDEPETHNNLGSALREAGRLDEAVEHYREALRVNPAFHDAHLNLVHQRQQMCDWDGLDAQAEEVRQRVRSGAPGRNSPFFFLVLPGSTPDEQRACAEQWAAHQARAVAGTRAPYAFAREARPRIRLGYLSADFHEHATAYLAAELFELHDRERFEVIGYSYGPDDASPMRARLTAAFDRFVELRDTPFAAAADAIHADGVDILVDLKGYTQNGRPQIMALRPAPIQVNYLGYPGTMGAPFIDYLISDGIVTPEQHAPFYTERIARLPRCYQPNDRRRTIAATPTRADCGLPETGLVFCCFNHTYKILPTVFEAWMRLLQQIPGSVLWLLESNRWARENLRREAANRGIVPERLVFAPIEPLDRHLARLKLADLFLDTLPCNAHTTASDALWAGLPVLTCLGDTFASRVAGSLVHAVGLPELATASLADYEALALRLARNPDELSALRVRLAQAGATAPLFDTARYTRDLEALYERMWQNYAAGNPPACL